ncbi:MAG TPA: hypothetical protein VI589_11740 [Vicinamibacteria bacterium]
MRHGTGSPRVALRAVAALFILALPVWAAAEPLFGPTVYTKTASGSTDLYTDPVAASSAGRYFLWVQNGDDDGGRVSGGSVAVNGTVVVGDAQLQGPRELFARPITLQAGANSISVSLNGETGSFLSVLILGPKERPFLTVGRLLLPYASASPNLQIELKNGAHGGKRSVRVHFYDGAGTLVASSGRIVLERMASLSEAVSDLIANGAFSEGSIEVFYAGHGRGRVFGQVATTNGATGIASIVPLQHAGSRVRDPFRLLND